jgi:hypothetical protein
MSTLAQIRDGISSTVSAAVSGLVCYDTVPDVTQVPALVILPSGCEYTVGMGKCQNWSFELYVLCARTETRLAQDKLDAYLSLSGANSIPLALRSNPSLGLSDANAVLRRMSGYGGEFSSAKVPHVGAVLHLDVLVTM